MTTERDYLEDDEPTTPRSPLSAPEPPAPVPAPAQPVERPTAEAERCMFDWIVGG